MVLPGKYSTTTTLYGDMMDTESIVNNLEHLEERRVFSEKEEVAMIMMYQLKYPVEFQEANMTVDEIIALKQKHMNLMEEAQNLLPLVQNILNLPAVEVMVETEDLEYV